MSQINEWFASLELLKNVWMKNAIICLKMHNQILRTIFHHLKLKLTIHSLSNTRSPKSQLLVLESTFYGELIFIVISAINTFHQYQRGLNLVAAPCIGTFSIVKSSEKIYVLLILGVRKFDTAPYIGSSWFLRSLYWNIFYTKIFKKMKKGSLYWRAPWCEDPLYWIGSVIALLIIFIWKSYFFACVARPSLTTILLLLKSFFILLQNK